MRFSPLLGLVAATSAATVPASKLFGRGEDGQISCEKPSVIDGPIQQREKFVEGQEFLRGQEWCNTPTDECTRVSCSNEAGIYFCAPPEHRADIACSVVADYVDHIFDQCQTSGTTFVDACYGWQENSDGWWVSVGWDYC